MKVIAVLAVSSACLANPYASAQTSDFFMGAGLSKSVAGFNGDDFDAVSSVSRPVSIKSTQTRDTGHKLFGGYNFNENWAIEAGYADLGRFAYRWYANDGLYNRNIYTFDYKAGAWYAAAKGAVPVTGQLSVFGKLGLSVSKAQDTFALDSSRHIEPTLLPCLPDPSVCYPPFSASRIFSRPDKYTKTRADALIGVGVEYRTFMNTSIRFEYEDFGRFGDSDHTGRTRVTATTLAFVYSF